MLRIMIVDDELVIRKGLRKMIANLQGDYLVVADAENGQESIEKAKSVSPDLIITDIKMPDMTGLELIRTLKTDLKDTKYVILSGYGEFEYAREAIELGVISYLLKPVSRKKLAAALEQVYRKTAREEADEKEKRLQKIETLLYQGVYGSQKKAFESLNPYLNKNMLHTAVLICRKESMFQWRRKKTEDIPKTTGNETDLQEIWNRYCKTVRSYLEKQRAGYAASDTGEMALILETMSMAEVHNITHVLAGQADTGRLESVIFFTSDTACNETDEKSLFDQVFWSRELSFYYETGKMNRWNGDMPVPLTIDRIQGDLSEEICRELEKKEAEKAYRVIEKTIWKFREERILPRDVVRYFQGIFRLSIGKLMENGYLDYGQDPILDEAVLQVMDCQSAQEVVAVSGNIIDEIIRKEYVQGQSGDRVVQEVKRYIQEHYAEKITLQILADHVYLSGKYVSDLFKQVSGKTITEYVTEVRILQAKQLLRQMNRKIYEVSELVGYTDAKYFVKAFKKETGMSPKEYQRGNGN